MKHSNFCQHFYKIWQWCNDRNVQLLIFHPDTAKLMQSNDNNKLQTDPTQHQIRPKLLVVIKAQFARHVELMHRCRWKIWHLYCSHISVNYCFLQSAITVRYWHQRANERHGNPPQGNQELLVVRDKVGRPPGEFGISKSMECDIFPSVLWYCWLGERKGIRPVKSLVLVCWWWWFDWSFDRLIAPVVTNTSIIFSFNTGKPRFTWKMATKTERES